MTNADVTILLVEDDDGHARLIEKALRRSGIANRVDRAADGRLAVDYLWRRGSFAGSTLPLPLLVVLDLNLPVLGGLQVLERMRADDRLGRVPVIVLTTADDTRDVNRCYDLGCNFYVTKPTSYDALCDVVARVGTILTVVAMPNGDPS